MGEICIELALKLVRVNKLVWGETEGGRRKELAQVGGPGAAQQWEVAREGEVSKEMAKQQPLRV